VYSFPRKEVNPQVDCEGKALGAVPTAGARFVVPKKRGNSDIKSGARGPGWGENGTCIT